MERRDWAKRCVGVVIAVCVCLGAGNAAGQAVRHQRAWAANVVLPQSRRVAVRPERNGAGTAVAVEVTEVIGSVDILDQVATTTLEIRLKNTTRSRQEAELVMPVPDGAVIRHFTYQGAGNEGQAEILPREEARRIYDGLVARIRDPALLEFVGYNLVRSSVFPVEANGTQWVRLTYEHLLESDGARVDYVLPRSEMLDYAVPWKVSVKVRSSQGIATVYSPTHEMSEKHVTSNEVRVEIAAGAQKEPGAFRLSYLVEREGVTASMLCYPDPKVAGGYFLLLAGLPGGEDRPTERIQREVTLVIDRSGSMRGEKIEQVKEAVLQTIAGLSEGETFNIVVYSNTVELFAVRPVRKSAETERRAAEYVESIQVNGGTNIHDALVETLRQEPTEGALGIVIFLTDGLPTVGQTSERAIREAAEKGNRYSRRIFTVGVGVDVNVPLLDALAQESRAKSTFILPGEDVEVKVGQVFRCLSGPVLAGPELEIRQKNGSAAMGRVVDVMPAKLPDLFEADQLVLLGKYIGEEPLEFRLKGNYRGRERQFKFTFDFDQATVKNAFVPRLWASRKIAELIDAVRQLGAEGAVEAEDPRMKELVDEIVRLSTEFGILTEYTAFLAREGDVVAPHAAVVREAADELSRRAIGQRSGAHAVAQSFNIAGQKAARLNTRNTYYNQEMERVSVANVQQVNSRALYQKGGRWIESNLLQEESERQPNRVVEFGTEEFFRLVHRLADQQRQSTVALRGDVLLEMDGEVILVRMPK